MENRDYAIGALLAAIFIVTVILAHYYDEIGQLRKDVTTLQNRLDILESYNFEHSKIEE